MSNFITSRALSTNRLGQENEQHLCFCLKTMFSGLTNYKKTLSPHYPASPHKKKGKDDDILHYSPVFDLSLLFVVDLTFHFAGESAESDFDYGYGF